MLLRQEPSPSAPSGQSWQVSSLGAATLRKSLPVMPENKVVVQFTIIRYIEAKKIKSHHSLLHDGPIQTFTIDCHNTHTHVHTERREVNQTLPCLTNVSVEVPVPEFNPVGVGVEVLDGGEGDAQQEPCGVIISHTASHHHAPPSTCQHDLRLREPLIPKVIPEGWESFLFMKDTRCFGH